MICHWMKVPDAPGGKVFIPGCMGAAHFYNEEDPFRYCTCQRRPRYRKGEKSRLKRLYFRLEAIKRRIDEIEDGAPP